MSISTSIWVRRLFSGLVGLLALYCLLLDLSWGGWEAFQGGSGYGIVGGLNSGVSNIAAQAFNQLYFTDSISFLLSPINLDRPFSTSNAYALMAYIILLIAAVIWAGAGKDANEMKAIDNELKRERRKRQRAGEEVAPEVYKPVYDQNASSVKNWVDFQNWIWCPIIAPLLVAIVLYILGLQ
ncbi:hypothetical protein [Larsenimonas suaedae]|uniref:Uncharacterized protein n=1 Tax=Larsenimonas suaedae TaxID=1851019 RepID=A0ABU1GZU0_9GAMM|nr:hypothetical protein [Larsenimonas suaedae]MCM2973456.1 hypothetical protein [Larsenimonas suaedae]MDR5897370.1 hypothetical protein [Larsenimonas suaedae]